MKKIILLLDADNSRFLVINGEHLCELPMIRSKNLSDIDKKIYSKYKIKIKKDIVIIEQNEDFCFIKCSVDNNAKYNKSIYQEKVINEIIKVVTNQFHKDLLLKLSTKIGLKILNDAFWMQVIAYTHEKISDRMIRHILFDFLARFSSSFCNEVMIYKYGKINDECIATIKNELNEMRENYFKMCPTEDSNHIKSILTEMGVNFDTNDFNIVLLLNKNTLIDVNSRTWETMNNYDKYCHVILSPVNWIKNLNLKECKKLEPLRSMLIYQFVKLLNQYKFSYRSYSLRRLFNNILSKRDKIYIMQRIGLIKTVMLFSDIFASGLQYSDDVINSSEFLLKVKSSVICELGDIDSKKIPFLQKVFKNLPKEIPDEFYPINRKCRNNLHYGFYNELSEDEIEILKKNQDIYLKYVADEFEKQITLNFGFKYYFDLALAKINYWASHKNML